MRQDARHARKPRRTRARRADGVPAWREHEPLLDRVAEVTGVACDRLSRWIDSGLLCLRTAGSPGNEVEIALADASRIRSLCVSPAGDKTGPPIALRHVLDGARALQRDALEPMRKLILIATANGELLVRRGDGQRIDPSRRLRLTSDDTAGMPAGSFDGPKPATDHDWHESGIAHELVGEWHEAIDCYSRALRVGGPDADIVFDLAHALAQVGEIDRAAERYRQVIEIDPLRADAWFNLARLLSDDDENEAAIDALRQALEIDPDDVDAHQSIAEALDRVGRSKESREHRDAAERVDLQVSQSPERPLLGCLTSHPIAARYVHPLRIRG